MKRMLDRAMVERQLVGTRTQANSYIKLGLVKVNRKTVVSSDFLVGEMDTVTVTADQMYVSRAALKLASVSETFKLDFRQRVVLDVGSSTGGFTDFALKHGASKVIAVEVGSNQMHADLVTDKRVELHEQTDIRNIQKLSSVPDLIMVDVSFISLREVLPCLKLLTNQNCQILAMFKPQFESSDRAKNKGIIKNDRIRRQLAHDFETWLRQNNFTILNKADSKIAGSMGNLEKFYLLKLV
jgi:23S rRNA (cytidine1920-2'-O)/16S rRNA (cytidine1409-2'-O)-methyltransferase